MYKLWLQIIIKTSKILLFVIKTNQWYEIGQLGRFLFNRMMNIKQKIEGSL